MGTNPDRQSDQGDVQRDQTETRESGQQSRDRSDREPTRSDRSGDDRGSGTTGLVDWFTETFLRASIALLGVLLLLFALGQIAGVDMIGGLADLLGTEIVQWTLVAVFALLLIVAAGKSWDFSASN